MNQTADLFRIETNINFEWTDALSNSELDLIARFAGAYEIAYASVQKMRKRNIASALYRLSGPSGEYVLRVTPPGNATQLEAQAVLAQKITSVRIAKPLLSSIKRYVTQTKEGNASIYRYEAGEIFTGKEISALKVIESCKSFLLELKGLSGFAGIPTLIHPVLQGNYLERFLNGKDYAEPPFSELAALSTYQWCLENKEKIFQWLEACKSIALDADKYLTHNDLNHANILIKDKSVIVLDLEDLCVENINIAAAHCIFKLLRHSVYSNAATAAQSSKDLRQAVANFPLPDFKLGTLKDFFGYAAVRIFLDLELILGRLYEKKLPQPTDLEKKLLNLFELELMISGE